MTYNPEPDVEVEIIVRLRDPGGDHHRLCFHAERQRDGGYVAPDERVRAATVGAFRSAVADASRNAEALLARAYPERQR